MIYCGGCKKNIDSFMGYDSFTVTNHGIWLRMTYSALPPTLRRPEVQDLVASQVWYFRQVQEAGQIYGIAQLYDSRNNNNNNGIYIYHDVYIYIHMSRTTSLTHSKTLHNV